MSRKSGFKLTQEHKNKIGLSNSISLKGRKLSEDHRKKVIRNLIPNNNFGKKLTEKHKQKISFVNKGKIPHEFAKDTRKKMSLSHKGKKFTEEHKRNIGLNNLGKHFFSHKNETRQRMSKLKKKFYQEHPEFIKIIMKNLEKRPKSILEQRWENIAINQLSLPYIFTGNGKFYVERMCPDFINCNGEKIAVEVFYRSHKEKFGQAKNIGIDEWKRQRQETFNKYGWKIEFFDETQVNEEEILRRLNCTN